MSISPYQAAKHTDSRARAALSQLCSGWFSCIKIYNPSKEKCKAFKTEYTFPLNKKNLLIALAAEVQH
jgi:hypothetical protein